MPLGLDYGAGKFIDHTVIGGHSLGVSQTIIALLIAGAECEEASQLCISEFLCKLAIRLARRGGCCHSVTSHTPDLGQPHGLEHIQQTGRVLIGSTVPSDSNSL